jgi:AhpD family alkylhydroperoxidase
MRLAPIEKPRSLLVRLAYALSRRRLGKVMTPMKVVYARLPRLARINYGMLRLVERGLSLPPSLVALVELHGAAVNGCSFCFDLHKAEAIRRRLALAQIEALPEFRTSPLFDERERAALAYVEEATRHKRVSDGTFERLRRHFDEREIVELTWLNALQSYFNLIAIPLGIESDGFCLIAARRRGGAAATAGAASAAGG